MKLDIKILWKFIVVFYELFFVFNFVKEFEKMSILLKNIFNKMLDLNFIERLILKLQIISIYYKLTFFIDGMYISQANNVIIIRKNLKKLVKKGTFKGKWD